MELRVVLVEPMYDGNVGSIARAMKNFGYSDLVLVNPCQIDDFGLAMASHAKDILASARTTATIEEAVEGADLAVGTTGKRLADGQRHLRLHLRVPCLSPPELADKLRGKDGRVALLLGREDVGLTNDELMLCDMVVSIPTSNSYPVMNISHAAAVLLYELSDLDGGKTRLASGNSLCILRDRAREILVDTGYPMHKVDFTVLMLRRVFGRAGLTEREANTLLGVLKSIKWKLDKKP